VAEAVYETCSSGGVLLLGCPTGSGKTLAALVGALKAALEEDLKVVYLARTKSQFQAPLRELVKISRKLKVGVVALMSKKDLCPLLRDKPLDYEEFLRACAYLASRGLCRLKRASLEVDVKKFEDQIVSPDYLWGLGLKVVACPYELAKRVGSRSRVIIAAYNYLFDPEIRNIFTRDLNVDLERAVIIVDEAHNLPDVLRGMFSKELRRTWVVRARAEVREFYHLPDRDRLLASLSSLLSFMKRVGTRVGGGRLEISSDELAAVAPSPSLLFEAARRVELQMGGRIVPILSYTRRVGEFLKAALGAGYNFVLTVEEGGLALRLECIRPPRRAMELFERVHAAVLMSGTMPPVDYLVATLGMEGVRGRLRSLILSPTLSKNVKVVVVRGVTSRYVERGEQTYAKMAEAIDALFEGLERGVALAVFPSYDFLKGVRAFIRSQPVFVEREGTRLSELVREALSREKLLALCVAWGKIAEGVEITRSGRSLVRLVILAGLPVPEPTPVNERLLSILTAKTGDRDLAWKSVYLAPAALRVVQAIGRSVRYEGDRAVAVILDERALDPYFLGALKAYGFKVEEADMEGVRRLARALEGLLRGSQSE